MVPTDTLNKLFKKNCSYQIEPLNYLKKKKKEVKYMYSPDWHKMTHLMGGQHAKQNPPPPTKRNI